MIAEYLAAHTPPPGVRFVLLGWTFERNARAMGYGVPADIPNQVLMVANQYDGWADAPTNTSSPGYQLAQQNAEAGKLRVHNYIAAQLDNPANVVTTRGQITSILIPTQKLPINDQPDAQQRALIDDAYSRPGPTPEQLAAATSQQVSVPPPPNNETPEPVAAI